MWSIGSFLSSSTISWRSRCKIEDHGVHQRNSLRTRVPLSKIGGWIVAIAQKKIILISNFSFSSWGRNRMCQRLKKHYNATSPLAHLTGSCRILVRLTYFTHIRWFLLISGDGTWQGGRLNPVGNWRLVVGGCSSTPTSDRPVVVVLLPSSHQPIINIPMFVCSLHY